MKTFFLQIASHYSIAVSSDRKYQPYEVEWIYYTSHSTSCAPIQKGMGANSCDIRRNEASDDPNLDRKNMVTGRRKYRILKLM